MDILRDIAMSRKVSQNRGVDNDIAMSNLYGIILRMIKVVNKEKPVHVTVRLYKNQRTKMAQVAREEKISRSGFVRKAIDQYENN